jgi:hypothetical protein
MLNLRRMPESRCLSFIVSVFFYSIIMASRVGDPAKLAEAKAELEQGQKAITTSMLKWKADWLTAEPHFKVGCLGLARFFINPLERSGAPWFSMYRRPPRVCSRAAVGTTNLLMRTGALRSAATRSEISSKQA